MDRHPSTPGYGRGPDRTGPTTIWIFFAQCPQRSAPRRSGPRNDAAHAAPALRHRPSRRTKARVSASPPVTQGEARLPLRHRRQRRATRVGLSVTAGGAERPASVSTSPPAAQSDPRRSRRHRRQRRSDPRQSQRHRRQRGIRVGLNDASVRVGLDVTAGGAARGDRRVPSAAQSDLRPSLRHRPSCSARRARLSATAGGAGRVAPVSASPPVTPSERPGRGDSRRGRNDTRARRATRATIVPRHHRELLRGCATPTTIEHVGVEASQREVNGSHVEDQDRRAEGEDQALSADDQGPESGPRRSARGSLDEAPSLRAVAAARMRQEDERLEAGPERARSEARLRRKR